MKIFRLVLVIFVFTSCSMIEKAQKEVLIQEKMLKALETEVYPYSLSELKAQIDQYYTLSSAFDGKWVYVTEANAKSQETLNKINEIMEEGFFYKEKLYTSELDLMDLFKGGQVDTSRFIKAKYHLLEDNSNEFLLAKGSTFFEAKSVGPKKSTLKIYRFNAIKLNLNINWWNVLRKKSINSFFQTDPPSFEESRPYAVIDKAQTLSFFYKFNKERAQKLEAEFSK